MFKKRIETFECIRWDGENREIIQGQIGFPAKKVQFGALSIAVSEKEKVNIKKGNFVIKSHLTGKVTSCGPEEFEQFYQRAR